MRVSRSQSRKLFRLILFLALPATLFANDEFRLQRLEGSIKLDGFSDEPAWQKIAPLPITMFTPVFEGDPTERTEIRVTYDDRFLYVSGRLYDSDPDGVQANSLIRDVDRGGDFLNFLVDTFNDNENFVAFVTTPAGNRLDAAVTNDGEGIDAFNQNWNAFWDNAVAQNDSGWFVEMRIPFSSLRFQSDNGRVVFGLMTHRLIGRKNERLIFPAVPPKWASAQWKPSQAQDVVLYGVYSRRPLYLTPYVLAGQKMQNVPAGPAPVFEKDTDFSREIGLDLKYGVSNNATLDLTVNTDFAQVEADNEQINLTRFSLFFPEKRQFFQERSGVFSFRTGQLDRMFYSRRIGLTDQGQPVRILGGARLISRIGPWDLGFLDMQTAAQNSLPTKNFGVLRLRRRTMNNYSYIGGMATSRVDEDGDYNLNYGLDAILRLFGNDYLNLNWAHTIDKVSGSSLSDASLTRIDWERRSAQGTGYEVELAHIGRDYNPELGFVLRNNVYRTFGRVSYGFFPKTSGLFRRVAPSLANSLILRKSDNEVDTNELHANCDFELWSGAIANVGLKRQYESLIQGFAITNSVAIPAGEYHFYSFLAGYQEGQGKKLRLYGNIEAGSFFDGNRIAFSFGPIWNPSRYLELSTEYELNRLRFSDRDQSLDANIVRARVQAALNTHLSGSAFVQYNSVDSRVAVNFRLRYNFSEGHDLYAVYNETVNTDRFREMLVLPRSQNRAFLIKYARTFVR